MSHDDADLRQRVRYMERLLRHYVGDISFDLENLQGLVKEVENESSIQRERSGSEESEYVGTIEEEKFTVQPLGNNATRGFLSALVIPLRDSAYMCVQTTLASSHTGTSPCG